MRFGIDLGGTKIEIVGLDDETGEVVHRARVETDKNSYEANIKNIVDLVAEAKATTGHDGTIGIGTPGSVNDAGNLEGSNAVILNGKPITKDLEKEIGQEVRIMNDANCFALSEASDGAAAGLDVVFGVILGTGVGGGVIVHGRALPGVNNIAGEFGHNPLPDSTAREIQGRPCFCGRQQCNETWLSGPSFTRTFDSPTGAELEPKEIVALMRDGDKHAEEHFGKYVDRLARALGVVINMLDPDAIVLGGGMSNVTELYEAVPKVWDQYCFRTEPVRTKLVQAMHGDSSGVRGAAWLWPVDA